MSRLHDILNRADRIVEGLGPCVTEAEFKHMAPNAALIPGNDQNALGRLGITLHGRPDCEILVGSDGTRIGNVTLFNMGERNTFVFENRAAARDCTINLRVAGSGCDILFADINQFPVHIANAYLRSDNQLLYWGKGATSVMSRCEIEGIGRRIVIGDDCMLSSGVFLRNHDMHTIFDVETLEPLNEAKSDIVLEQHVWLGFDVVVMASPCIGFGSIVGARSLVRQAIPPQTISAGSPAKILRMGASWCRSDRVIYAATLRRLERVRRFHASRSAAGLSHQDV